MASNARRGLKLNHKLVYLNNPAIAQTRASFKPYTSKSLTVSLGNYFNAISSPLNLYCLFFADSQSIIDAASVVESTEPPDLRCEM